MSHVRFCELPEFPTSLQDLLEMRPFVLPKLAYIVAMQMIISICLVGIRKSEVPREVLEKENVRPHYKTEEQIRQYLDVVQTVRGENLLFTRCIRRSLGVLVRSLHGGSCPSSVPPSDLGQVVLVYEASRAWIASVPRATRAVRAGFLAVECSNENDDEDDAFDTVATS
jgi:hypothetical protein